MPKLMFDFAPDPEPEPSFIGPRIPPCKLDDHQWRLDIEDGRANLICLDACSEERKLTMDTTTHPPGCDFIVDWYDTIHMEPTPVKLKFETEYTPGEFGGQGEYDAWLEVTAL